MILLSELDSIDNSQLAPNTLQINAKKKNTSAISKNQSFKSFIFINVWLSLKAFQSSRWLILLKDLFPIIMIGWAYFEWRKKIIIINTMNEKAHISDITPASNLKILNCVCTYTRTIIENERESNKKCAIMRVRAKNTHLWILFTQIKYTYACTHTNECRTDVPWYGW